jgi:leader peptidase (prepilin peptidase)/N-methyltransferase
MHIPDAVTYPAIPLCMVLSVFMGLPHMWDGVVGGVAGYLLIRLIADGYELLTGRRGMGYGDAKLLAMVGGLLGWQVLLPTLFLSALQGSVIGIAALLVVRRRQPETSGSEPEGSAEAAAPEKQAIDQLGRQGDGAPEGDVAERAEEEEQEDEAVRQPSSLRHAAIPFGPFISLAAVEMILLRDLLPRLFPYFW